MQLFILQYIDKATVMCYNKPATQFYTVLRLAYAFA